MTSPNPGTTDVPTQVFEAFLQALGTAGMAADLISRLRKTLLEDKKYSDKALMSALGLDEEAK